MKNIFKMVLAIIPFLGISQSKTLEDITKFSLRNSGAIVDKNFDVDGYYFFYEVDKLKKKEREFAIQILDKNLNDMATKSYVNRKGTALIKSGFNNQALMFLMANKKEEFLELVSFDTKANQNETIKVPVEKKEMKMLSFITASNNGHNILFPVDDRGFVLNLVTDNKKMGYKLKYVPTDGRDPWEFSSPADAKEILTINPIEVNEKVIVALEMSKKSLLSQKINIKILVINVDDGKVLFERSFDKEDDPRLITNAFLSDNSDLILLGEYFDKGDHFMKDQSLGLFAQVNDLNGNILSENKLNWDDHVSEKMEMKKGSKTEKNGYIYFHDIIKTQRGNYYAIGETYRKTASAGGIAAAALGGGNSVTQLTIKDVVIFKFNSQFGLEDVTIYEKGTSRAPSITDFGSPQLNAHILKNFGAFDYEFTQRDIENDRFYSNFIDFERLKGEKNKLAFKTIIYDDGELSEDKIYLDSDSKVFRVFPAKVGHVMLLEYDKKEKKVDLHIESLNIK